MGLVGKLTEETERRMMPVTVFLPKGTRTSCPGRSFWDEE